MGKRLRLLLLEDSEDDEMLVLDALRNGGFEPEHKRVWSANALREALAAERWDAVISDYCMPGFQAPDALAIVRESGLDLPFIIVSGTMGEDLAVAAMKAGAHDYVMKDMLGRLVPSLERELRDAQERADSRLTQELAAHALMEKQQAEAITRAKSQFLAKVSHELRTPLNAIIGFSELMQEGVAGSLSSKQAEYLGHVINSGHHLLKLVSDLLDLSKIEAGKMELAREPLVVHRVVTSARDTMLPLARRKGVALILDLAPGLTTVEADPLRLLQMLYNLVSNAINFTSPGGQVVVEARAEDQVLRISVSDTGIGIAPEDQVRLFDEFRQVGVKGGTKSGGTGLGLAVTKQLVELHGGTIEVQSKVGFGSRFTLSIPLRAPEPTCDTCQTGAAP